MPPRKKSVEADRGWGRVENASFTDLAVKITHWKLGKEWVQSGVVPFWV